jgi:hypothetical protein
MTVYQRLGSIIAAVVKQARRINLSLLACGNKRDGAGVLRT